jgi:hypothetical protein
VSDHRTLSEEADGPHPADPGRRVSRGTVRVGVLADPEAAPVEVAQGLDGGMPGLLGQRLGDEAVAWEVHVRHQRLPGYEAGRGGMLDVAEQRARREGWDLVVCLTDLPLWDGGQPIVADLDTGRRVAVLSLPAFGGMRLGRRAREVMLQLVSDLLGEHRERAAGSRWRADRPDGQVGRGRRPELAERFERVTPDSDEVDVRIVVNRGRLRMLVGVVRANRPWRLVLGLRGAAAVSLAFSTYWLLNPTLWSIADAVGSVRLALLAVGSVVVMVLWLVLAHRLWEPRRSEAAGARTEATLFNAATVVSLAIGVSLLYAVLFVLVLLGAEAVLAESVLGSALGHAPTLATFVSVAWLATTASTVGGALGVGFESDQAVREAAYGYRQRQRVAQQEQEDEPAA